ncbi:hypothetical protein AB0K52_06345 [Glycomyces sp. NPDC049804]|uniref:hypothetical protein n=1 Tax=Glycomyces sp. NPDC049804 TaxID=3154363 RepID=UPI00343943DB
MAPHQSGLSEAETCELYILPALRAAGWTDAQIRPQYRINNGRLISSPKRHIQDKPLVADYVLEPTPDLPVGILEAKAYEVDANDGVEQARRYAGKLGLPFAYASNGRGNPRDRLSSRHDDRHRIRRDRSTADQPAQARIRQWRRSSGENCRF